jgi:hypothetical protein
MMPPTPNVTTVTTPLDVTAITAGVFDPHWASLVTSLVVPSEKVAVAVSCLDSPTTVRGTFPVIAKPVTVGDAAIGGGLGAGGALDSPHPPLAMRAVHAASRP